MKKMQVGGENIAYDIYGDGDKDLVLIHGNMTSSVHYQSLIDRLENDYKIYALDLPGFGQSSYNQTLDSLEDYSEIVSKWMQALGLEKCYVAGWSTGGGIAMLLAIHHPELVNHLFLIESVGIHGYPIHKKDASFQPILTEPYLTKEDIAQDPVQVLPVLKALENKDKDFYRALFDQAIYNLGNYPSEERRMHHLKDHLTQRNLIDIDYALTRFNISHDHNGVVDGNGSVDRIKCPVSIIQGKNDLVVPQSMGDALAENIKNNHYFLLSNSGHNPMVDQMDKVVEIFRMV